MSDQSLFVSQEQRLPWPATAAALVAFAALAGMGGITPVLPFLSLALLATYVVRARIQPRQWWLHWVLRLVLYTAAAMINFHKPTEGLVDSLLVAPAMDTWGQVMAVEFVIQAWRQQPTQPPPTLSLILLGGLTLAAACQTSDQEWPRFFVPLYMFFLLLTLAPSGRVGRGARIFALLLALTCGVLVYSGVWYYRNTLMSWGSTYLDGRTPAETSGLSVNPRLGDTFGLNGSPSRILQIIGLNRITYLRAVSFDTYLNGRWGPSVASRLQQSVLFPFHTHGRHALVIPLKSTSSIILAPLHCAGINLQNNSNATWSVLYGGPVLVSLARPSPYLILQSSKRNYQGPLAFPPTPQEIRRCLALPAHLDPGINRLAQKIAGTAPSAEVRIHDVEDYLMSHHRYSLTFYPGPGDPVASFLLRSPPAAAHCEYFASAAALLLRCVGVPTRYVIGYYAHEQDSPHVTVVREWDAHAWAEAWVVGTGWVTVDATPGGGRPHETLADVPLWQRIREWFSEQGLIIRTWASQLDWVHGTAWLGVILFLALLIWVLQRRRHRKTAVAAEPFYTISDEALADLALRFDQMMARHGQPCPLTQPWQEHLAATEPSGSPVYEFVQVYNQVRFGHNGGDTAKRLAQILTDAERQMNSTAGVKKE